MQPDDARFQTTLRRLGEGARDCLPVALSVIAYGMVFGVLARQKGLAPLEVLAMSGLVFSGSAQFVVLDLWTPPLPLWPIVLATAIVSLRYLLICASCRPLFAGTPLGRALAGMFLVSDENWAVTMTALARGRGGRFHLLGGGVVMYLSWTLSTALGCTLGALVDDPARWGLDFAFVATFLALLVGLWRGPSDLVPWAVAAASATAASLVLPGKWYILIGGLAGSLSGVLRRDA
jgi:predicted branched-subunit amino acid permease